MTIRSCLLLLLAAGTAVAEPAFDQKTYDDCVAKFDKGYDVWQPVDKEAKAVLARVKGKSPYVAVPALLRAYERVDTKAAPRQTGGLPPGAMFATATRVELTAALAEIQATTHFKSCIGQITLNADTVMVPLTGDRERDKVLACGGPDADQRKTQTDARKAIAEAFNKHTQTIYEDHTGAGIWSKVKTFRQSKTGVKLTLSTMSGNRTCVKNGKYGKQSDGSWGPLCDMKELPTYDSGETHNFDLAVEELPTFQIKPGDEVIMSYELDPDAPAGANKVPRKGGWWWLTSLERGKKDLFSNCKTDSAHQVEVSGVWKPLFVIVR